MENTVQIINVNINRFMSTNGLFSKAMSPVDILTISPNSLYLLEPGVSRNHLSNFIKGRGIRSREMRLRRT